jgi:hypothetical protein
MFLQQIQCMEAQATLKTLDSAQQKLRLDTAESETIEATMVAAVNDDGIVKIDKIICYIDELYQKAINEERTKTHVDEAIKCADEQLQKLHSRKELVQILNRLSRNNKLKHIIRENIDMETTSGIVLSAMIKTGKKTSELDTQTLTDLLVLQEILVVYQTDRQVINNVDRTIKAVKKISENLMRILEILQTKKAREKLERNKREDTLQILDETYSNFVQKLLHQFLDLFTSLHDLQRQLNQTAKQLKIVPESNSTVESNLLQLEQNLDNKFKELKTLQLRLHTQITQLYKEITEGNSEFTIGLKNEQQNKVSNLQMEICDIACRYIDDSYLAAEFIQRHKHSIDKMALEIQADQLPCFADPRIEGKIDECMKHVMDPSAYIVDEPHTNDDNSRLLTIGGIAILGVVTIGAGWYLFSNDNNNNTSNNRTIQLSRKTTTSMQLAKPINVSATKTTDVSAQPNALAQTHQEQIAANQPN